jgi:hypothetical protein
MAATISYGVPDQTTSLFLVVTDQWSDAAKPEPPDGVSVVAWRKLGSPLDPDRVWAYANWDDPQPRPSVHHVVVSTTAGITELPLAAQRARAHARRLAVASDGVLIDWLTGDMVHRANRPERQRFLLADRWLGVDDHVYEERHQGIPEREPFADDWPDPWAACGAIRIGTLGLIRFGVPDLLIDHVDCMNRLVALNVLRALAQHLLTGHMVWLRHHTGDHPRQRRIPAVQQVPGAAFGSYWGSRLGTSDPFAVRLLNDGASLAVGTTNGQPLNDWLSDLSGSLAYVAASPADDFDDHPTLDELPISGRT